MSRRVLVGVVADVVAFLLVAVLAVVGALTVADWAHDLSVNRAVAVPGGQGEEESVTVTRHEAETHIVTSGGVLIIVPGDRGQCVRVALPSAEYAECVPDSVG